MPQDSGKIKEVQMQVDGVKAVMQENVEVMLSNLEKTEVLEDKASNLAAQAKTFHKSARETKRHMCRQNAKMNLIIAAVCIIVLLIIIVPTAISVGGSAAAVTGGGGGDTTTTTAAPTTEAGRRLLLGP